MGANSLWRKGFTRWRTKLIPVCHSCRGGVSPPSFGGPGIPDSVGQTFVSAACERVGAFLPPERARPAR